ncbi:MAG: potassium transporter KtrB [Clostridiaceae bacterium]|nr:potassium transporter KtrB [Clostridiaceae bacterium]
MKKKNINLSTTQIIALGFFGAILIGTLLLMLPFCSADGYTTSFIDAFFTATTSVCVTGLVVVPTYLHWSIAGKVVILILSQLGGLGIISFTTAVMMIIGRRITLKDRLLLEDALNLNTLSGLVSFLRKILKGTFLIEGIGAICYALQFIPEYGLVRGLCYSVFHSVTAFCNAGIDLLGDNSFEKYLTNPWINFVTIALIILGGIGFIVWWDIIDVWKRIRCGSLKAEKFFQKLHLNTKIVLITTAALILSGTVLIFILEYSNPNTIGNLTPAEKLMASLFEAVTTRTAGFATFSQAQMRGSSIIVCIILMFIGGSSIGTAGGIKTNTFAVLALSTFSTIHGRDHLVVFHKNIPHKTVQKALAVTLVSAFCLFLAIIALSIAEGGAMSDIAFEVTSAISTSGLTRDFTGKLHTAGKLIIILCMYLGRIGPISLAIVFSKSSHSLTSYPTEDITVG